MLESIEWGTIISWGMDNMLAPLLAAVLASIVTWLKERAGRVESEKISHWLIDMIEKFEDNAETSIKKFSKDQAKKDRAEEWVKKFVKKHT